MVLIRRLEIAIFDRGKMVMSVTADQLKSREVKRTIFMNASFALRSWGEDISFRKREEITPSTSDVINTPNTM
jgi:hypothetical protein